MTEQDRPSINRMRLEGDQGQVIFVTAAILHGSDKVVVEVSYMHDYVEESAGVQSWEPAADLQRTVRSAQ